MDNVDVALYTSLKSNYLRDAIYNNKRASPPLANLSIPHDSYSQQKKRLSGFQVSQSSSTRNLHSNIHRNKNAIT